MDKINLDDIVWDIFYDGTVVENIIDLHIDSPEFVEQLDGTRFYSRGTLYIRHIRNGKIHEISAPLIDFTFVTKDWYAHNLS